MEGKIIIFSAPSGCGKSTIIRALCDRNNVQMHFCVSATNRPPRTGEIDGVHYYFLSTDEFKRAIDNDEFVEYEEVYPQRFYGTLKSEIDTNIDQGRNVVLDIDVKGALSVKRIYGDRALSMFILPPSTDILRQRLEARGTETPEAITQRLAKADYELSFAPKFDKQVINDQLSTAVNQAEEILLSFTSNK